MESELISFEVPTAEDMHNVGFSLGQRIFPSAFIALYGDLGAGKTTFVKGVADALGITDVSSPTFTIVHRHHGRLALDHFDAYRIEDPDELTAIGFDDHIASDSVIIMEWCENVPELLPPERLEITISGSGEAKRFVEVRAFGKAYQDLMEASFKC